MSYVGLRINWEDMIRLRCLEKLIPALLSLHGNWIFSGGSIHGLLIYYYDVFWYACPKKGTETKSVKLPAVWQELEILLLR